ncbi:MAG: hypothetical protein DLM59_10070 [Pseudonocardiales bacterium]|nr:MAG: hypothetical protein DLM59_10070 [Pseudonocardiales bacterium]
MTLRTRRVDIHGGATDVGVAVELPVMAGTAQLIVPAPELLAVRQATESTPQGGYGWRGLSERVGSGADDMRDRLVRVLNGPASHAMEELHSQATQRARYDPARPQDAMAALLRERQPAGPIHLTAAAGGAGLPYAPKAQARLLARTLQQPVTLSVTEPGGAVREYVATPTGELNPGLPDGGYAAAWATLRTGLERLARAHDLDLRAIYAQPGEGSFTDRVLAALRADGVEESLLEPRLGRPVPEIARDPREQEQAGGTYAGQNPSGPLGL